MPTHFKHNNEDRSMKTPTGLPKRRRGGQELPDELQDRPEQNAGYDDAVHNGPSAAPADDLGIDVLRGEGRNDITVINPDDNQSDPLEDIDDQAERGAIGDVRRREKRR